MKRTTRRSSIFQPSSAAAVEEKRNAGSSFDTKFSLPSFIRRVEKLTENQRAAIARMGFGNLLNIHNQMISKVLLVDLMERWDSKKMVFMLPHGEVAVSVQDVALILGLRVIGKSVVLDEPFSDLEQEYGATPLNRKISISSIEDRLESIGGSVNEDFIRSFLLFTFGIFLFPNSTGKADSCYLNLLKDLDKVHEYAWGEAVLQDLFSWIGKRKEENVRCVGGCLLLLQVWSYEHIDIGRPNLLVSGQFPRASRWESIRSSYQRQWLSAKINKLEEDQITWVLHPTTKESEIDVVKQFLEAERAGEGLLVGQSSTSGASTIECDDAVGCRPETKEIDPLQCPPNEDFNEEIPIKQELIPGTSDASLNVPVSHSETKEIAELRCPPNLDLDEGMHIEQELVSEASEASLDMPIISKSPAIIRCTSDVENGDKQCLPSSTQNPASVTSRINETCLQTEDFSLKLQRLNELKEENAMLRDQLLLIPQLQEENAKLRAEVENMKKQNEQMSSSFLGLERLLSEFSIE